MVMWVFSLLLHLLYLSNEERILSWMLNLNVKLNRGLGDKKMLFGLISSTVTCLIQQSEYTIYLCGIWTSLCVIHDSEFLIMLLWSFHCADDLTFVQVVPHSASYTPCHIKYSYCLMVPGQCRSRKVCIYVGTHVGVQPLLVRATCTPFLPCVITHLKSEISLNPCPDRLTELNGQGLISGWCQDNSDTNLHLTSLLPRVIRNVFRVCHTPFLPCVVRMQVCGFYLTQSLTQVI